MDGIGHPVQTELTTDPDGPTYTAKSYDGMGRVYQSWNPTRCSPPTTNCGTENSWGSTTYIYDALGRTTSTTEQDGSAVLTTYNQTNSANTGSCSTVTDEVGNSRQSCADGLGRMTGVFEAPTSLNYETDYVYDPLNNLLSVTQKGGSTSGNWRTRTFYYDSLSRLTSATNPESGSITYTYDLNGNLATKISPKAGQTGTQQTTLTYSYDALNRMVKKSSANPGNLVDRYAYDGNTLTTGCGQNAPIITNPTNLIGRRSATCSNATGASWSYDPMGRTLLETSVTNAGSGQPKLSVGYAYNLDGSIKTMTYPSGDIITYTPGGAGRPLGVSDSSTTYVASGSSNHTTYAPSGALASMANGYTSTFAGIITSNTYNARLQPTLLATAVPTISVSVSNGVYSTCSALPCTAAFTVSSSAGINVDDVVTVAGNTNGELNGIFTVTAVASGQVTVNFGLSNSGGSGTGGTLTDDLSGAIFSLCYDFHSKTAVSSGRCSFSSGTGNNGNVFQVLNKVDSTRSAAYIYDSLNRIAQAYTLNATSANCWGETFSPVATAQGVLPSTPGIDPWGNLTNRSGVTGMSGCATEGLSATATTNNQLGGIGMIYDAAGNVTNEGQGNLPTYDAENRVISVAGVNYYYDADGSRTDKSSGTKYWYGSDGAVLAESSGSGVISEEYVYFNGQRIGRVDRPSGTVHYYFSNQVGSHTMVTSATGTCEQDIDYFPYGGVIQDHCPVVPQHYLFTGKERDSESGLDNFGARYFVSSLGRFMTPDWAARPTAVPYAVFGDPQSLNLYTYVRNDPVTRADADGHTGERCYSDFSTPVGPVCTPVANKPGGPIDGPVDDSAKSSKKGWWASLTGTLAVGMARISPAAARKLWEAANPGQKVPFDTVRGRFQDMAHILARADGGKDVAENLKPQEHGEHTAEHMAKGDFARWAARAKDAVVNTAESAGKEIESDARQSANEIVHDVKEAATEVIENPGEALRDAANAVVEAEESGEIPPL